MKIYPKCKNNQFSEIYINAEGTVFPCCWIANKPHVDWYVQFHNNQVDDLNITHFSLDEIIASEKFNSIENSWLSMQPNLPCRMFCSNKIDEKQEMHGNNQVLTVDFKKNV